MHFLQSILILSASCTLVAAAAANVDIYLNHGLPSAPSSVPSSISIDEASSIYNYILGTTRNLVVSPISDYNKNLPDRISPQSIQTVHDRHMLSGDGLFEERKKHMVVVLDGVNNNEFPILSCPQFTTSTSSLPRSWYSAFLDNLDQKQTNEYGFDHGIERIKVELDNPDTVTSHIMQVNSKIEQFISSSDNGPKVLAVEISGLDLLKNIVGIHSEEYRTTFEKIKSLLEKVASFASNTISHSLIISPTIMATSLSFSDFSNNVHQQAESLRSYSSGTCFGDVATCNNSTASCSNRGQCESVKHGCFRCVCNAPTASNNKVYTGDMCQYEDVSAEIVLLGGVGLVLILLVVAAVQSLVAIGEMPSSSVGSGGGNMLGGSLKVD